jgi:serine/threonine-protein phosphatase 2B catalytic subunit
MLLHIIKKEKDLHLEDTKDSALEENISKNKNNNYKSYFSIVATSLKMKVKFITLMMKMYKTLREENELIMKLKGFCPGNKIPRGILMQGPEALKTGKNFK